MKGLWGDGLGRVNSYTVEQCSGDLRATVRRGTVVMLQQYSTYHENVTDKLIYISFYSENKTK